MSRRFPAHWTLVCVALLLWTTAPAVRAEETITFKPDPETKLLGPQAAAGALIYLHGSRIGGSAVADPDGTQHPSETPLGRTALGFADFARHMRLDTFLVVRSPPYDVSRNNTLIATFILEQIERLAKEGYRSIYLAGASRGGWLAMEVATRSTQLAGVLIASPGDSLLTEPALTAQRDALAALLSQVKARKVFVAFFEDDPREAMPRGQAAKAALEQAGAAFFILDRPPDVLGHSGIAAGRFVRRYRDCLIEFFTRAAPAGGGFDCAPDGPYASGADIKFPPYRPSMKVPSFAEEPLARFVGRWEGDNEGGAYVILASTEMLPQSITFLMGHSPYPHTHAAAWVRELKFTLDKNGVSIRHEFDKGAGSVTLKPVADDALSLAWQSPNLTVPFRMILKKRSAP